MAVYRGDHIVPSMNEAFPNSKKKEEVSREEVIALTVLSEADPQGPKITCLQARGGQKTSVLGNLEACLLESHFSD